MHFSDENDSNKKKLYKINTFSFFMFWEFFRSCNKYLNIYIQKFQPLILNLKWR